MGFFSFFKKSTTVNDPMKYLIVGLGNIGSEYDDTRHNVGFEVVDAIAKKFNANFIMDTHAYKSRVSFKGRTFVLIKPTTYMNLSGKAVRYWMEKEKITKENVLVILDDLNLAYGKIRLKPKGSDGGHNGLKNIDLLTGGNDYSRLRIGIGNNFSKGRQVDYVLGKWSDEERVSLSDIISNACEATLSFGTIGLEHAMNQYNK